MKTKFLITTIILLALTLRLYQFGSLPKGVNRDEAAIGYTAYLLSQTGADEHGKAWPLRFESFGDWKQPLYIYLTIPITVLFGMSPITVRFLSLAAAMVMIGTAGLIMASIAPKKYRPLAVATTMLLLTLNPWHFHFSRLALEPMVAASLFSGAILLLMRKHVVGIFLLLATLLTYHASLIVVPLWFMFYLWINRGEKHTKTFSIASALFFGIGILMLSQSWFSPERAKVTGTTIFSQSNDELWSQIYQYRDQSIFSKLRYNRAVYYTTTIASNYAKTFTTSFLLQKGGNHPHYNVPGFGNFLPLEILLLALGVVYLAKNPTRQGLLMLSALLLAPLPAAITKDSIHSTREIFMLPEVQIIAGLAAASLASKISTSKRPLFSIIIIITILTESLPFYRYYFGPYTKVSDRIFAGYQKDIAQYLYKNHDQYRGVYLTYPFESPYMLYAFYNRLSAQEFRSTIEYYPVDNLGFRYAKKLQNIEYPPSTKELLASDPKEALILSRVQELPDSKYHLTTWSNQEGQVEIVAICTATSPGTKNTTQSGCQ